MSTGNIRSKAGKNLRFFSSARHEYLGRDVHMV